MEDDSLSESCSRFIVHYATPLDLQFLEPSSFFCFFWKTVNVRQGDTEGDWWDFGKCQELLCRFSRANATRDRKLAHASRFGMRKSYILCPNLSISSVGEPRVVCFLYWHLSSRGIIFNWSHCLKIRLLMICGLMNRRNGLQVLVFSSAVSLFAD